MPDFGGIPMGESPTTSTTENRPVAVDRPSLVDMPLAYLIVFWQPGSHDWSWSDEYRDLIETNPGVTDRVRDRVAADGIGFVDEISPVLLGTDGRVWDGHHRICIAIEQGIASLMVERADEQIAAA